MRVLHLLLALVLLSLPLAAEASTVFPDSTYDYGVTVEEGATYVVYRSNTAVPATGDHFTRPVFIGDSNIDTTLVRMQAVGSDTTEVDVFVEFSFDRLTWLGLSDALHDSLSLTVATDTLDIVEGVDSGFRTAPWMRLRFSQQTGSVACTVAWATYMRKNPGAPTSGVGRVLPQRTN